MNPDNPLQRYKIEQKIGTGGMASVFLAHDTVLNRAVAVKMVHPHLLNHAETLKRFSNEAKAIALLSHENIIAIFDFGEAGEQPFIVMEYVDGITLEALIAREGTIPGTVTASIALQVLAGLVCAHDKGIYHRDIKPGNILIDAGGSVRITDFGIAFLVCAESVTLTGSFLGSPHYISPEQVSNKTVRGNTDVFSLGVVLYQCLTGSVPFDADTPHGVINRILTVDPPCPSALNSKVLLWLADLVEQCLIKDASERPGSRELHRRLEETCRAESIGTGKDRIAAFVKNPAGYRAAEAAEIVAAYREKALSALRQRRIVSALRSFEQASRFGPLQASDRKLMGRIERQTALRRGLLFGGGVLLGAGILYLLGALIFNRTIVETRPPSARETPRLADTAARKSEPPGPVRFRQPKAPPAETAPVPPAAEGNKGAFLPAAGPVSVPAPASRQPSHVSPAASRDSVAASAIGFLKCLTNPPWVTIYIDDIERGKTPTLRAVPLSSGRHVVHLVKQQFVPIDDTVTIAPAETSLIRIRLLPEGSDTSIP